MREMRKGQRRMDTDRALEVFDKAPYVTLSMVRPSGLPYAVPVNMVRRDAETFYFHCAFEGEKIDCLREQPVVSLSAVSRCHPAFEEEKENFTEHYHSAIALGKAETVNDPVEKTEALRLLCERFLPKNMDHFETAVARSLERTNVIRIRLLEPPVGKKKGD